LKAYSTNLSIKQKIVDVLENHIGEELSRREIIRMVIKKYHETNPDSVIPSDYCYNLYNTGINFDFHILEYVKRDRYKVIGLNHNYNGPIFWKGTIIGEWRNGQKIILKDPKREG
jgi:hypothetical protein